MQNVFRTHPEFTALFDRIVTSEDITHSKPAPDCYLKAAARLGVSANDCVVFEDSINGLKSGLASGANVVGLLTTNPLEKVCCLSAFQIVNYNGLSFESLMEKLNKYAAI